MDLLEKENWIYGRDFRNLVGKKRGIMGLIYIYVIILIIVMCIFFELKVYNYLVLVLEVYIYWCYGF